MISINLPGRPFGAVRPIAPLARPAAPVATVAPAPVVAAAPPLQAPPARTSPTAVAPVGIPGRFWVAKNSAREIVILDGDFGPRIREHRWFDAAARQYVTELCVGESEPCPLCARAEVYGRSYVALPLTVADLGAPETEDARRILAVRAKTEGPYLALRRAYGGLRGLRLSMTRGDEFEETGTPTLLEAHTEDEVMTSLGDQAIPFAMRAAFPRPDGAALHQKFGTVPATAPQTSVASAQPVAVMTPPRRAAVAPVAPPRLEAIPAPKPVPPPDLDRSAAARPSTYTPADDGSDEIDM
ncbi:hypothetical protein [Azospirillum argentinense]|uniref:hypothetical protein n=1 Tax=Azospirillum argentinense TaxID=2970906 RepID=UPI0032DEC402